MRVFVHIGDQKSGSTSIQSFIAQKAEWLEQNGFTTLETTKRGIFDSGLAVLTGWAEPTYEAYKKSKKWEEPTKNQFLKRAESELEKEVRNLTHENIIVSFEGLIEAGNERAKKATDLLAKMFDDVQVIAILRRNDRRVASGYSSRLKNGATDQNILFKDNGTPRGIDYLHAVGAWADCVGDNKTHFINFDKTRDVMDSFAKTIGISLPGDYAKVTKNKSLSGYAAEVTRRFNEELANQSPYSQKPRQIRMEISRQVVGEKLLPARHEAQHHYEHFRGSNIALAQRFFGWDSDFFDNDFSNYPESRRDFAITDKEFYNYVNQAAQRLGVF